MAEKRKACRNYPKYKGIHPPRCGNGSPCPACLAKYAEMQAAKDRG